MFSSVILNIGMEWTNKLWLPATSSSLSYSWAGTVHSHLCTPQAEVECRSGGRLQLVILLLLIGPPAGTRQVCFGHV